MSTFLLYLERMGSFIPRKSMEDTTWKGEKSNAVNFVS